MASIKQTVKQILVNRQHNLYQKELMNKNLDYNTWIREVENRITIPSDIAIKNLQPDLNCQTNDLKKMANGGKKNKNDGKQSKDDQLCKVNEISVKFQDKMLQLKYLQTEVSSLFKNPELILDETKSDVILISLYSGVINVKTIHLLFEKFLKNENLILIYGDEDRIIDSENKETPVRDNPWFKPDWSPDEFLSFFYFGGLVAVRTVCLKEIYQIRKSEGRTVLLNKKNAEGKNADYKATELFYQYCYEMLTKHNAFTKRKEEHSPVGHIRQVLYHSFGDGYDLVKRIRLSDQQVLSTFTPKLSIIIPSRDNPDVLFKCLDSILEVTDVDYKFEIILVDNGSNEKNRLIISENVEKYNYLTISGNTCSGSFHGMRYVYNPMEFNFSTMCNVGASHARGNLFLFLNDDMEIIQADWLDKLIEKAILPYAGAVGAKLLYPNSEVIQHAGITNLRVGPAHKLQFLKDSEDHYFGKNRGIHDCLAVTGACLMVSKSVFDLVGGFYEGLAVAFNDVDLCYSIYEHGYYNIVREDVVLYHHESLSRGKDGESETKQLRLQKEKDVLYERHQNLYGQDPFYHPYLTTDMLESEYSPAFHYQVTLDMPWSPATSATNEVKNAREDKCLVVGMECAMDIYKWKYGVCPEKGQNPMTSEENGYYFQGYSFIIGADNACYKKKLLMKNRENNSIFAIPVDNRYRIDIKNNLSDQLNVDLTGFASKLSREKLPDGIYQFGMLAEDKCSRQKLVNWSNWVLEVGPNGQ